MTDLLKVFDSMQFDNKDIGYNSRVLIVDALNTFMRSYAAIPTLDEDGNHIGGMAGFMKSSDLLYIPCISYDGVVTHPYHQIPIQLS